MYRARRLRKNQVIRNLMQETKLSLEDFIYPIFVVEGTKRYERIPTLPDVYHHSLDCLYKTLDAMVEYGIHSCILFGVVEDKDACGSVAWKEDGIIQQAIAYIKRQYPQLYVIADVCMCEYTDHGHCGILNEKNEVDNDKTLPYLGKIACSYAKAGVDMVAPSAMMDGQIAAIRKALDEQGFYETAIMGYSAKFASSFYGPFREAANSTPQFGDRKQYQMHYANGKEAMREIRADEQEGADILMVKPAMAYLDILAKATQQSLLPFAVYQVSGEYAMLKMAIANQLVSPEVMLESLLAMKRAGASFIISYEALHFAKEWKEGNFYGTKQK